MFTITIPHEIEYPFSFFHMDLRDPSPLHSVGGPGGELKIGQFGIASAENRIEIFPATSGLTGHQTADKFGLRGHGPLPDSRAIDGKYALSTEGYPSAKAGGLFFHITPDPVHLTQIALAFAELNKAMIRADLGLHWDNRKPGTSGCTGIIYSGDFDVICATLLGFHRQGKLTIPHYVTYDW